MEISKFIIENNINNFETFKLLLESDIYNLKIKEDKDYPELFLIHHLNNTIFDNPFVNECNGIIMEKNNLKIICYTFNKCSDTFENIDLNNLYIEHSIEGTLIRLFYYNEEWIVSTKKCIDASKSIWISKKNFLELFEECLEKYFNMHQFKNILNKSYCYSFIIMHPENKIVVNYITPSLYHISTRDLNTFKEICNDIGIPKPKRNNISYDYFQKNLYIDTSLQYEGYIFSDLNYNRCKIKNPYYNKVRYLWGNTNNRFYRYIELRKDYNILNEYIYYFSNDTNNFLEYEKNIQNLAYEILRIYLLKYVQKNDVKIPFYFSKIIYKLHENFLKNKIKTDYNKIMLKLLELEPKKLYFMINNYSEGEGEET